MNSRESKLQSDADFRTAPGTARPVPESISMTKALTAELRISVVATLVLALLVSGIYPLVVWAIAQGLFPYQSGGSLIQRNGIVVGSELIAQNFENPKYFHSRPSAAGDAGYDAANSAATNLGPLSKRLLEAVQARAEAYRTENGLAADALVPADAVTASGSGLDPHIRVGNARLQAARVAAARGIPRAAVERLLEQQVEGRDLGVFGEPRVNVLKINVALDRM
jgi:potassium-transporting ATPase KdpC subunit